MSEVLDKIKELFKSKEEKEREKKEEEKFRKGERGLVSKLIEMDREYEKTHIYKPTDYSNYFPKDLNLEKVEYDKTTDDDIKKFAKTEQLYDKRNKEIDINKKHANDLIDRDLNRSKVDREEEENLLNLRKLYKKRLRDNRDKSVKNGVLNSSIHDQTSGEIEKERDILEDINKADASSKRDALIKKYESLSKARDEALKSLDVKYANDVDKRIKELKVKLDRVNAEKKKANDDVDIKETNYDLRRESMIRNLQNSESARENYKRRAEQMYGPTGDKLNNVNAMITMIKNYYDTMPANLAAKLLSENTQLARFIGRDNYYNLLLGQRKRANIG